MALGSDKTLGSNTEEASLEEIILVVVGAGLRQRYEEETVWTLLNLHQQILRLGDRRYARNPFCHGASVRSEALQ